MSARCGVQSVTSAISCQAQPVPDLALCAACSHACSTRGLLEQGGSPRSDGTSSTLSSPRTSTQGGFLQHARHLAYLQDSVSSLQSTLGWVYSTLLPLPPFPVPASACVCIQAAACMPVRLSVPAHMTLIPPGKQAGMGGWAGGFGHSFSSLYCTVRVQSSVS